jgi:multicomponent Na+:H+ antiporter subunit E
MMSITLALALWLLYLLMTSNFELRNLVLGAVIALALTLLIQPQPRRVNLRRFPRALFSALRYVGILIYDMFAGGLFVAGVLLRGGKNIRPGIIAVPSGCDSELANALSAHAITLGPGELVVEIDEQGVMYTHVLDVRRSESYIEDAQRLRRELFRYIFP